MNKRIDKLKNKYPKIRLSEVVHYQLLGPSMQSSFEICNDVVSILNGLNGTMHIIDHIMNNPEDIIDRAFHMSHPYQNSNPIIEEVYDDVNAGPIIEEVYDDIIIDNKWIINEDGNIKVGMLNDTELDNVIMESLTDIKFAQ